MHASLCECVQKGVYLHDQRREGEVGVQRGLAAALGSRGSIEVLSRWCRRRAFCRSENEPKLFYSPHQTQEKSRKRTHYVINPHFYNKHSYQNEGWETRMFICKSMYTFINNPKYRYPTLQITSKSQHLYMNKQQIHQWTKNHNTNQINKEINRSKYQVNPNSKPRHSIGILRFLCGKGLLL